MKQKKIQTFLAKWWAKVDVNWFIKRLTKGKKIINKSNINFALGYSLRLKWTKKTKKKKILWLTQNESNVIQWCLTYQQISYKNILLFVN